MVSVQYYQCSLQCNYQQERADTQTCARVCGASNAKGDDRKDASMRKLDTAFAKIFDVGHRVSSAMWRVRAAGGVQWVNRVPSALSVSVPGPGQLSGKGQLLLSLSGTRTEVVRAALRQCISTLGVIQVKAGHKQDNRDRNKSGTGQGL